MFTGPICSMRWRRLRQVSSSAASILVGDANNLRVGAQHRGLDVHFGRQLASRCSRSERSLAAWFDLPLRSSRSWSSAARAVLSSVSIAAKLLAQRLRLGRDRLCHAPSPQRAMRSAPVCRSASSALSRMRCSRSASLRLAAARSLARAAPGPRAADRCAGTRPPRRAAALPARPAPPYLRRFLLQLSRFCRICASWACSSSRPLRPARVQPQAARLLRASAR